MRFSFILVNISWRLECCSVFLLWREYLCRLSSYDPIIWTRTLLTCSACTVGRNICVVDVVYDHAKRRLIIEFHELRINRLTYLKATMAFWLSLTIWEPQYITCSSSHFWIMVLTIAWRGPLGCVQNPLWARDIFAMFPELGYCWHTMEPCESTSTVAAVLSHIGSCRGVHACTQWTTMMCYREY